MCSERFFAIHNNKTSIDAAIKAGFTLTATYASSIGGYCDVSIATKAIYPAERKLPVNIIIYPNQLIELGLLPCAKSRLAYIQSLKEDIDASPHTY